MTTIDHRPSRISLQHDADERRAGPLSTDAASAYSPSTGRDSADRRIIGTTSGGKPFRPGDWAERLAGVIALFVKERRPGSSVASTWLAVPYVDGSIKCLNVSGQLAEICPEAFDFVMQFAADNQLQVQADA
jgi:hypothetical protein